MNLSPDTRPQQLQEPAQPKSRLRSLFRRFPTVSRLLPDSHRPFPDSFPTRYATTDGISGKGVRILASMWASMPVVATIWQNSNR